MKTIRLYEVNGKPWFSLSEWFAALKSGKSMRFVLHFAEEFSEDKIIQMAVKARLVLAALFRSRLRSALGVLLTGIGLALLVRWPLIKWLPEIEGVLIFFFLASSALGLFWILRFLQNLHTLRTVGAKYSIFERGVILSPPVNAYREIQIPKIRLVFPIFLFLASILLNSIVFASYYTPAVIWTREPQIVREITLVAPWTDWEQRPRILKDYDLAYFTMEGDTELWVMRIDYVIERLDPLQDIQEGRDWIPNVLNYYVDLLSNNIYASMPAGLTQEESIEFVVNNMQSSELINFVEAQLISTFGQRYPSVNLRQVTATIEKMKVTKYQDYLQSRQ